MWQTRKINRAKSEEIQATRKRIIPRTIVMAVRNYEHYKIAEEKPDMNTRRAHYYSKDIEI